MTARRNIDPLKSLQAKAAVHKSWANTPDRAERTKAARMGFIKRFEREVDPDELLDPRERAIRADHAMKAYLAGLQAKALIARRRKARSQEIRKGATG